MEEDKSKFPRQTQEMPVGKEHLRQRTACVKAPEHRWCGVFQALEFDSADVQHVGENRRRGWNGRQSPKHPKPAS